MTDDRVPEHGCEQARAQLDLYISNELPAPIQGEVSRHVGGCPACSAELEARLRLRARLKDAVEAQAVPPELRARIREAVRAQESRGWLGAGWNRWAVAAAAGLVVCAGVWFAYSPQRLPALSDRPAQNLYIRRVSSSLAAVLKIGIGDHIHCSIFRQYPHDPPPVEQMEEDLGPGYRGLLPLVKAAIPDGYRVIMGHQCSYAGRNFIHLTLRKGDDLISLVISKKNPGETLEGLSPQARASGVPLYQSAADRYEVAGFEAGRYFAFVVSELRGKTNLQIAASLAPSVREFLVKTAA